MTQSLKAFKTNVLQWGTPLATYAHLAPSEPIAHPGRGMPVLSSTVHIARQAFSKLGSDDFLLPFSCTSARCCCLAGLVACTWGRFLAAGHAKTRAAAQPSKGPTRRCDPPSLKYMTIHYCSHQPISMGKFRIQPCSRALPNGAFGAQVSVASGRGSASTDRVMRFVPEFATPDAASQYALDEGMLWVERQTSKPILL